VKLKIALKTTNKNKNRVESCLNTWLSGLDYVCITDRPTGLFNEISCGLGEDYASAEEKTCNFFLMVKDGLFSEYDWIILLDDDAVLDAGKLSGFLPCLEKDIVHGYDMLRAWPEDLTLSYPSGGGGYLVSPSLVRRLPHMNYMGIGLEDVRVGLWMRENGVGIGKSLPLGPWFPFGAKYWKFIKAEEKSPKEVEMLFSSLSNSEREFVKSKITHHYVRGLFTMKGICKMMSNST
jgi:hypothetical protein